MKRQLQSLTFLAVIATVVGMLLSGGTVVAQDTSSQPQAQQPQQPPPDTQPPAQSPETPQPPSDRAGQAAPQTSDQAQPEDSTGGKEFIGMVVKQGDKYIFQDAATGTTYDIDHQDQVKKFEGKKVRVRGTLDPNGKMIHVQ